MPLAPKAILRNWITVDQQTKATLKQDNLLLSTEHGIDWVSANRSKVMTGSIVAVLVLIAAIVGAVVFNKRSEAASEAFGAGMQAYQTPIAQPGQPVAVGTKTYETVAQRAKAANALFRTAAEKYSMTKDGKVSLYFQGLTSMEAGDTHSAEDALKQVAGGWDANLAALAKLALAQLYRQTGRDSLAVDLYNQLTDKPAATVPANLAQLQLAELYTAENKPEMAKKIYATLKDKDAKGAAGQIATQKLNPAPAGGPPPQQQ
jgi:predicted negative regulator of RcsB-dependent stress response